MSIFKLLNLIFFVCIIFSCTHKHNLPSFPSGDTTKNDSVSTFINDSLPPEIENIDFNISKLKEINFGIDSLSDSLVLHSIFSSYETSESYLFDDDEFVAVWKSTKTKPQIFIDYNAFYEEGEPLPQDTLPYKIKNFTQITKKQYFKNALNTEFCLVSFTTSNDYPAGNGRYSSGLLSLALFKKDKFWKLENFNLLVNYQGVFSKASTFDTIVGNYIIINGGKANPDIWQIVDSEYVPRYSNLYFIDLSTLKEILKIPCANCASIYKTKGSSWSTTFFVQNNGNIKLFSKGKIDKKNFWGCELLNIAIENIDSSDYWKKLPRKFEFELENEYSHDGNLILDSTKNKLFKGKQIFSK